MGALKNSHARVEFSSARPSSFFFPPRREMASLLCLLLLLSAAAAPRGTAQLPSSCAGRLNELPIADGPPRTVAKVKNGERLVAGEAGSEIPVVHVSGTAFEMGEAHGRTRLR